MNRLRKWYQAEPPLGEEDARRFWRERILSAVLVGSTILGFATYLYFVITALKAGQWGWFVVYTLAFAWVLVVTIFHKINFNLRSISFLLLLFMLGLVSALQYGPSGDARIWFIGFTVLTGVFLGARSGVLSAVLSTATLLVIGLLMSGKVIFPTYDVLPPDELSSWISTGISYLVIGLIIVVSVGVLVNGINSSFRRGLELTEELARDRDELQQRAQDLERRETQIHTAAEISRAISAELDPDAILQRVVNLLFERFSLYYVGAFVVDDIGRYAVLRAGTGEPGKKMLAAGHRLDIGGNSMIGQATALKQARIALDVGAEAVHFDNPLLPDTRSELALPMVSAGEVMGALTVQSVEAEAFDRDDIAVLQGVADSLATALINARLFNQVQNNLEEIQTLHRQYLAEAWSSVTAHTDKVSYSFENQAEIAAPQDGGSQPINTLKVPLLLRDQIIGQLTLESDKSVWKPDEKAFIEAVTNQAVQALENMRLLDETQRSATRERIIADIVGKVWASYNVDTILQTTVQELGQALDASEALIQLKIADQS